MLPPDRKGAFFRALRAGERPGDPGEAKAEGATRTLVFVLFRAGFFQLLGGTAGRAPEPVEEEYMQSRGKYVAEEGDAMGRLVAGVFFKGEDVGAAYRYISGATPGKDTGSAPETRGRSIG